MSDVTQKVRASLEGRLAEIDDEVQRLQRALSHLGDGKPAKAREPRSRPQSRKRSKRRAKRGERAAQFLDIVGDGPGIQGADVAKKMGVPPSQVYGLASRLEKQGKIKKSDSGYQLAG